MINAKRLSKTPEHSLLKGLICAPGSLHSDFFCIFLGCFHPLECNVSVGFVSLENTYVSIFIEARDFPSVRDRSFHTDLKAGEKHSMSFTEH